MLCLATRPSTKCNGKAARACWPSYSQNLSVAIWENRRELVLVRPVGEISDISKLLVICGETSGAALFGPD